MAIVKASRKYHKWLMLFVGVQLFIWAATGTYMVVMDIDYIHGDGLISEKKISTNNDNLLTAQQVNYSLNSLLKHFPEAKNIRLTMLQGNGVYQFKQDKKWQLVSAKNGKLLAAISQKQAENIAKSYYSGQGNILTSKLVNEVNGEISPRVLPAWQITFDDFASPRLYISAQTGELVTKRHSFWVLFDWLFRFHIMDYGEDEDATNTLLLIVALISLLACLTGVVLTYVSFVKVRGKSIKRPKSRKHKAVKVMPWIRFFHRWLSLIVFAQLLIWLITGLYFNLMDHQKASGNQLRQPINSNVQTSNSENFASIKTLLQQYAPVKAIRLVYRLNEPYYLFTFNDGLYSHFPRKQILINAQTGQVKNINKQYAQHIAQASYKGNATVKNVQLLPNSEALPKQQNPLWQVDFKDAVNTSAFVDAQNASIIAHVNDDKRLADFMFKLHFMDYRLLNNLFNIKMGGFNNAQIILLALLTLLFSLTGIYWLAHLIFSGKMYKKFRY